MSVKPTQAERVLWTLQTRGAHGMCSIEPIRWSPPILRTASRINDLRNAGHNIESVPCLIGDHGDASAVRYVLITEDQKRLF